MKKIAKVALFTIMAVAMCGSAFAAKKEKKAKKTAAPFTITEDSGVIGYFTFDEEEVEDNELIDHSGNELNVFTGALDGTVLEEGKIGNAMNFNGDDEYITLDDSFLSGDGFTIAAWVKPTAWKDWARVFDIGDGNQCDCWCGMDWNTKMLRMDLFGEGQPVSILSPLPPVDKWTHIAAVVGNGKAALYVNGKLAQKLPCAVTSAKLGATVNGIYIGRSNWSADPLFNGLMDELLVANRAFSDAEIASVYAGIVAAE